MKRFFYVAILFLLLVCAGFVLFALDSYAPAAQQTDVSQSSGMRTIELGGETMRVWVADTPALRELGLSGRDGLASDEAMLFIFPADGRYAFWMKDMRFSIDIIWLSADGSVVDRWQNASPASYPHPYQPTSAARYVVELPAGFVKAHNIALGDIVRL